MADLNEIVKRAIAWYASGGGDNLKTFVLSSETDKVYAVNIIDTPIRKRPAGVVVMARIVGDKVVIEEDTTDRPLVNALIEAGIPRDQIVLAYAGESIPEAQTS